MYFHIALQTLLHQKKRYVLLFLVCLFGVFISLTSFALMNGMVHSLRNKACLYYGGDLQILIGDSGSLSISNVSKRISELEMLFPPDVIIAPRIEYDANFAGLYFEGEGVRQRIIKGVDFMREGELFSRFTFTQGDARNMTGSNGILLSEPLAEMLSVQVGDVITLLIPSYQNYQTTAQLTVQGIFQDSSLFGMYTSYLDIENLRSIIGYPPDWASRIGVFYPDGAPAINEVLNMQTKLETVYTMFPFVEDKQIFYDAMTANTWSEPHVALIMLEANLQQIQLLLDAVRAIAYLIVALLIAIIAIGLASTYKVIVHKRINEIGMYMALGMSVPRIILLFLTETLWIIVFGFIGGIILLFVSGFILQFLNFSFIPAFDIFLEGGHLMLLLQPLHLCVIISIIAVTTLSSVLFTIRKTVDVYPSDALRISE